VVQLIGKDMRQELNISIKLKNNIKIPEKANRTNINGEIYATDINGKGLYKLVSTDKNENSGYLIDDKFSLNNKENPSLTIKAKVKHMKS
jgi:hypothetical protein